MGGGGKQTTKAEIPDELKPLYRSTANQMMIAQNANPMAGPSAWWSAQGRRYYDAPLNDQYYKKVAGYNYPEQAEQWQDAHPYDLPPTAWDPGRPKSGNDGSVPKYDEPGDPWNVGGQTAQPKGGQSSTPSDPTAGMTPAERAMYWQQIADQENRPRGGGTGSGSGGGTGGGTGSGSGGGTGNWWDDLPYSIPGMDDPGGPSDPRSGEPWVAQPGTWRPGGGSGKSLVGPGVSEPDAARLAREKKLGGRAGGSAVTGGPPQVYLPNPGGTAKPGTVPPPPSGGTTKQPGKYDAWLNETKQLASGIGGK